MAMLQHMSRSLAVVFALSLCFCVDNATAILKKTPVLSESLQIKVDDLLAKLDVDASFPNDVADQVTYLKSSSSSVAVEVRDAFAAYTSELELQPDLDDLNNFVLSLIRVRNLRRTASNAERRKQIGINSFAHMTNEEFRDHFQIADDSQPNFLSKRMTDILNAQLEKDSRSYEAAVHFVSQRLRRRLNGPLSISLAPRLEIDLALASSHWPAEVVQHGHCITPVRTQHPPFAHGCGSCWTHGAVGGLEMPLCVAKQSGSDAVRNELIDFTHEDPTHMLSLAVQEILDCTSVDNETSTDMWNHGCGGGDHLTAWNILMGTGLRSEEDFPGVGDHFDGDFRKRCPIIRSMKRPSLYPFWTSFSDSRQFRSEKSERMRNDRHMVEEETKNDDTKILQKNQIYRLSGYTVYPNIASPVWPDTVNDTTVWPQNATQLREFVKKGVREKGGVTCSVLAISENFHAWKNWTDIYYPDSSECLGKVDTNTGRLESLTNHEIVIIGYGKDNGRNYFKIKNSWSRDFGDDGFFRVSADHCDEFRGPWGVGSYLKTCSVAEIVPV